MFFMIDMYVTHGCLGCQGESAVVCWDESRDMPQARTKMHA